MKPYHLTGMESFKLQSAKRTEGQRAAMQEKIENDLANDAAYAGEVVHVIDPSGTVVLIVDMTDQEEPHLHFTADTIDDLKALAADYERIKADRDELKIARQGDVKQAMIYFDKCNELQEEIERLKRENAELQQRVWKLEAEQPFDPDAID